MKNLLKLTLLAVLLFGMHSAFVSAEELSSTTTNDSAIVVEDVSVDADDSVQDFNSETGEETVEAAPSRFGLWWRNLRETAAIALTFNPVKKAERRIEYAAKRMEIAERIAGSSDNPKVQARAERAIKRAQKYMDKVEERKDRWEGKKSGRLVKRIADNADKKERILERIENRLPENRRAKFRVLREKGLEKSRRLMNAIDNENIPEEVREHLQTVKNRIDARVKEVKGYNEERKNLRDRIKDGDEAAKKELKDLNSAARERVKEIRGNARDFIKDRRIDVKQLRNAAKSGDEAARGKIRELNQVRKAVLPKIRQVRNNLNERLDGAGSVQKIRRQVKERVRQGQRGAGAVRGELKNMRKQIREKRADFLGQ